MCNLITDLTHFASEDDACEYYFHWYRSHGYPNYSHEEYDAKKELDKLIAFDEKDINQNGALAQTMHSCGFLWTFFPHWIDVATYNDKSLRDNWNDDAKLMSLMHKTYRYCMKHQRQTWTTNRLRQNAKVYLSKQAPSNFRPTVSKYIYNRYGNGGTVYDPCGGWGGRMLGFLASDCKEYICCDPSSKTAQGLKQLAKTFSYVGKHIEVLEQGAETYTPQAKSVDVVFTSPPYFDNEHYCNEPTQSFVKFDTYEKWRDGFLREIITRGCIGLKDKGRLIINIANTKNAPNLERDTVEIAEQCGLELEETLRLVLSSIAGKGIKTEPVFVFKKKEGDK